MDPFESPPRQRGAIGLMAVGTLLIACLFLMLAVDSGRLYLEKRKLQRVADMAALEAAGVQRCRGNLTVQQAARMAAARNDPGSDGNPAGLLVASEVQVGVTSDGLLRVVALEGLPAVHVRYSKTVPASLVMGGFYSGRTVDLAAEAVAEVQSYIASFSLGSGLVRVNADESPLLAPLLNGLLDGAVDLSALSYEGLVGADVELLEFLELLKVKADIGTMQELLDSRIGALPFVQVVAELMDDQALGIDLSGASLVDLESVGLTLGEVLGVATGTPEGNLKADVNLFDLLMVGAIAANGNRSVGLSLGLPGVASANVEIIEPPQLAVGLPGRDAETGEWYTQARTGQLDLVLNLSPTVLSGLSAGGALIDVNVDLALRVGLAQAEGVLESIACSNPSTVSILANTQTDNLRLTSISDSTQPASIQLSLLGLDVLKADLALGGSAIIGSESSQLDFEVENASVLPQTQTLNGGVAPVLPGLSATNIVLLGGAGNLAVKLLLDLLGGVTGLLNAVLGPLASIVLQPLLTILGINLGVADVTLMGLGNGTAPRLIL